MHIKAVSKKLIFKIYICRFFIKLIKQTLNNKIILIKIISNLASKTKSNIKMLNFSNIAIKINTKIKQINKLKLS